MPRDHPRRDELRLPRTQIPGPTPDFIKANHIGVDQINREILPLQRDKKVQPKLKMDGSFPSDFTTGLTVDEMEELDGVTLDRILIAYGLESGFSNRSRHLQEKRNKLFAFLGAFNLVKGGLYSTRNLPDRTHEYYQPPHGHIRG
ncbi:hypothetical protein FPQ18DRAFT_316481 [Pyronema domesticum]|nr:hypothetical protein FPQ18DRAFT_316481 [Pyronema domesticum]